MSITFKDIYDKGPCGSSWRDLLEHFMERGFIGMDTVVDEEILTEFLKNREEDTKWMRANGLLLCGDHLDNGLWEFNYKREPKMYAFIIWSEDSDAFLMLEMKRSEDRGLEFYQQNIIRTQDWENEMNKTGGEFTTLTAEFTWDMYNWKFITNDPNEIFKVKPTRKIFKG